MPGASGKIPSIKLVLKRVYDLLHFATSTEILPSLERLKAHSFVSIRYDTDPFGADLPDDICALREIADSLTGRLRAVYEAMLQRAADGAGRMTLTDVQHEWNVSYTQIMKDTKKIEKMIRERIQPKYQKKVVKVIPTGL